MLQFVRIVGESLQILAADHDSACVIGRVNLDLRSLFSLHLDLLFLHLDFQRNIELFRLPRRYLDVLDERCEAAGSDRDAISTRRQIGNFEVAGGIRVYHSSGTALCACGYLGASDHCAGRVGNLSA